ncbi:Rne/Rng family ribonuclease [Shimia sagamensis]|uniref:Ribonuclease E n=1 Tax=Shimia sagamensis TaxID=1566352 RepID=A0ABY1NI21_9RHOB|nr:Rne/Rng family ribonuclease [Shimia sagamensis]SMP10249.1 ribonuclease E [Shimia sagamensis]
MAKKMLIDATHAEETRVVVVDGNKVEEFDFESENKRQLAGNIYLAKVTRVEPSLQAAFVDYGGNRHGFLAFSEIHPDYYQIPVADREALLEEERAYAESLKARDEEEEKPKSRSRRSRSRKKKPEDQVAADAAEAETSEVVTETSAAEISGMETIDLVEDAGSADEGLSPMELVEETPVEEPVEGETANADDAVEGTSETEVVAEVEEAASEEGVEETPVAEVAADVTSEEVVPEAEVTQDDDADVSADEDNKDDGPKTIAANTEGEDAVVSKDPETGAETETEASAAPEEETSEEAPAAVEDATVEEDVAVEAQDAAAEEGSVEAKDVTSKGQADADVAEEVPTEETVAETDVAADEVATKDDAATADTNETEVAETAEAESGAGEDTADKEASEADAQSDDEENGKKSNRRRSRRRGKRSDATEKDESIESVADDDDIEDIRPPRKPRARRYKIQEVVKVRQILLVQVVKEERGNKGAALTTYLSLAGRYCVLMPNTARGGGISRKITNAVDRKKLKEISSEIDVPQGAGLIVRTAGAKRTKSEIKRDYEYLQRLWEQIRELTLKSIAPAKIYEEGDLIKRSIRDLYSREIDEVLVEGERGYRIAKDFMKMIMPSHAKNVKRYQDTLPLFARYQVESYLSGMFNPTVQLKSGGYIVIGVTEALVAIDVNSGRATKEGSIEETALKTNLEAAEEVARQLRLRDLAGLIVIDFIDMDERKNNTAVEKRMKDKLKTDRARIQVGRISGFGLMEMSRQRLRPGMIEATTQPCAHCHGTGLIRSDDNLALSILREIEEEGTRGRSREVLVKAPVAIVNYLMNHKREHVAQIEARYGLSVRIEADPHLVSPNFEIEKFKTATRVVPEVEATVVSGDISIMDAIDDAEVEDAEVISEESVVEDKPAEDEGEDKPKKRRRRRRRRRGNGEGEDSADGETKPDSEAASEQPESGDVSEGGSETSVEETPEGEEKPKKRSRSRRSRSRGKKTEAASEDTVAEDVTPEDASAEAEAQPSEVVEPQATDDVPVEVTATPEPANASEEVSTPEAAVESSKTVEAPVEEAAEVSRQPEVVEVQPEPAMEPEKPAAPPKPKRRGWWSRG